MSQGTEVQVAEQEVMSSDIVIGLNDDFSVLQTFPGEYIAELRGLIDALPQAKFLDVNRINRWLSAVLSFEPERVKWHIKRLSGIGGSEIGTVVAPFMDEYDPFATPLNVYQDKMMIKIPEPSNGDMKRGIFMEDTIRDMFRSKYNAIELTEDLIKLSNFHDPKHPWLVGNPDDLVSIGGKNYMVDYKCPRPGFADKYDKNGISFGYFTQLHHYTLMAKMSGIQIDGLLLASFDMVTWDVDVRHVEMKDEVFDNIIRAGDWLFYDCIMKNISPMMASKPKLAITSDDKDGDKLMKLLKDLSFYNLIANQGYAKAGDIKEEITNILSERRMGGTKMTYAFMEIASKEVLNVEKASAQLTTLGYDMNDFNRTDGKYDFNAVIAKIHAMDIDIADCLIESVNEELLLKVLQNENVDPILYMDESRTIGLSKSPSEKIKIPIVNLKAAAKEVIEKFRVDQMPIFFPEVIKQVTANQEGQPALTELGDQDMKQEVTKIRSPSM